MLTLMWSHLLNSLSLYLNPGPYRGPWEWSPCPGEKSLLTSLPMITVDTDATDSDIYERCVGPKQPWRHESNAAFFSVSSTWSPSARRRADCRASWARWAAQWHGARGDDVIMTGDVFTSSRASRLQLLLSLSSSTAASAAQIFASNYA